MKKWHLRFGITSNCNFRCIYCNSHNTHNEDLKDSDIKEILEAAYKNGVERVHWTGGEPLFKTSICVFMKYAKELGYKEQSMTTNGFFLYDKAEELKNSGISRINISLDTMDSEKFQKIVGVNAIDNVFKGIEKMLEITDCLIKINMVVMKDNIDEIEAFVNYAMKANEKYGKNRVIVRFLQFFPCNPNQLEKEGQNFWVNEYINESDIINILEKIGKLTEVPKENIAGDNPSMRYYNIDSKITVGILAMFSWEYPCGGCYKLRISPQGNATVCLNDKETINVCNTTLDEKINAIGSLLNRRETVIEENVNRKHFRKSLGEFRFGKNGKEVEIAEFYDMLKNGKGKDCNI